MKLNNFEIVVELMKKNNIRHIVISPGGTNIPFVKMVQSDDFFTCYSVVDERSAVYFAIGLYLQTGEIIAMSCTSAQATRNYIPGLTEAFYKRVPILAITMSKHPRFTYQEYMQAPDQASIPNDCVKKSYTLPFIGDVNDVYHSIRIVNEAICCLTSDGYGPVQLCIPRIDFEISNEEPVIKNITVYNVEKEFNINLQRKKILLVIGERRAFSQMEVEILEKFSRQHNVVIYTNHLSNYSGEYSLNGNLLLTTLKAKEFKKIYIPDILITIGGQTGDYPLYKLLSLPEMSSIDHWRIDEDGKIIDTYDKLTRVYKSSIVHFFNRVEPEDVVEHSYYEVWKSAIDKLDRDVEVPFSSVSIAQYLSKHIPCNSTIQFSILNSLRIWELFDLDASLKCFSNVAAFGIDGGLSTLIGQSFISNEKCFMIIGDLAFFYDMNAIGIRGIKNNVRILLVNNNGGIEFKLYGKSDNSIDNYIAAANHFKNAEGWAETCGLKYLSAYSMDEFIEKSTEFIGEADRPILLEAFVSDIDESEAYFKILDANKNKNIAESLKSNIKNTLGQETLNKINRLRGV